ncbi:DNA-binding transcriptional regulator, HxlR family [Halopenitus malekzadehii]|jgi:DNA-binding HxlR family transcriptional regulator|uniref:DNA-binding transcriptional regulator, HxlR family n=1 Tax=Halopenitus malekzadehii TaxID=1267564 RepID=A0A1H6JAP0_9EURY|nr:helix-turn-helix domain-containing protein [Halopenitus malekzadehii]SEH55883.1 DNA-binding transcriptional regulator, HxlR family [Halopenitus malekzadehii]
MATQPQTADSDHESDVEQRNADVCNVVGAVEEMGAKWKLIVLNDLRDGEKRFNELKRSTGASSYTLSRVLDDLEAEGFVDNHKEFESPVASYYALTEKGDALCPVFDALDDWGEDWL